MREDLLPTTVEGKILHVIEEASEVILAYTKRERFGHIASDPLTKKEYNNTVDLKNEICQLRDAIDRLLLVL